jgi:hypothetical protein
VLFEGRARFVIESQPNPFRAVTHYHEEGKKESAWSCSNTHLYVLQGWKEGEAPFTAREVRDNLKSKGPALLQELLVYLNMGDS